MIESLLGDAETIAAAGSVHPGESVTDSLARAAWTVIAEPGDAVAGALIEALGAEDALSVAIGDSGALLPPGGGSGTTSRALAEGRARWRPRASPGAVRDALRGAADIGARLLIPGDEYWPVALGDLGPHAPVALWVRGRGELLRREPRDWYVAVFVLARLRFRERVDRVVDHAV